MKGADTRSLLETSLEDFRLSRSERRELRDLIQSRAADGAALARLESQVFELAEERSGAGDVLGWLRQVIGLVNAVRKETTERPEQQLFFSPRDDCPQVIGSLIRSARERIRVCVFTITDDRISGELIAAHERGIDLRILSDDDKSEDRGSDLDRLGRAGIPIALDRHGHMHHKFAVFDDLISVSGSYNWTRSAARDNHECILMSRDRGLAGSFLDEFTRLWKLYAS